MRSPRPIRLISKPKRYLDSPSPDASIHRKDVRAVKRKRTSNPLLPIAAEPTPTEPAPPPNLSVIIDKPVPFYIPPLKLVEFKGGPFRAPTTVLKTFQQLLCVACIDEIVKATNSYAARSVAQDTSLFSRPWAPTAAWELWRYIGILLYMGMHKETRRESYWGDSHRLGRYISNVRFEQLHRFFTIRDSIVFPQQETEGWFFKLEPVLSIIRANCIQMWRPGSHLAVDEAMCPYTGRSSHTVKMKNKPVKQGYKIWVLSDRGYVYIWLYHSNIDGVEGIPKAGMKSLALDDSLLRPLQSIHLAATYALVIKCAIMLRLEVAIDSVYIFFLDNLFLNVQVANALLAHGVLCMGTTRKDATGVPEQLTTLKNANKGLLWNSLCVRLVGLVLCFCWQDNNAVLGITTAYTLKETTLRNRRRPKPTSTNAHIVRPVFGDAVRKWLAIPTAIDNYNHYMNAVDINNQLRKPMTPIRGRETRNWRPLWQWLLDICAVNAYLAYKQNDNDSKHRGQRKFRTELVDALLAIRQPPQLGEPIVAVMSASRQALKHQPTRWQAPGSCAQCKIDGTRKPGHTANRVFGTVLDPNAVSTIQPRATRTQGGCVECDVYLCVKGDCFDRYHR
jgi:hypothetical protein